MKKIVNLNHLLGETMVSVVAIDNKEIVFTDNFGRKYSLNHEQDCSETVTIEDIDGNLDDLVGSPILMAEEQVNKKDPPKKAYEGDVVDSYTWTFYRFATIKGYVTIRWYGESNGYYSERVDLYRIE